MAKIAVFQRNADGRMPWNFTPVGAVEMVGWVAPKLTEREIRDLIKTGCWAPLDSPDAKHNWLLPSDDGTLWAGGPEKPRAPVAKVRGKAGRRTSGRATRMPPEAKVRTTSIQMRPGLRDELEALAAVLAEERGKRVTISTIFAELVDNYLDAYKEAQGVSGLIVENH